VGWLRFVGRVGRAGKLRAEGKPGLTGLTGARSLAQKVGTGFRRCLVADAAVWALGVVFLPERTGDHLRLQHAADQLPIEAFVPEAPIGGLVHTVLPRITRLDEADLGARLRQPFLQCTGHGFTLVVAPQVPRRPMDRDRRLKHPDHLRSAQLPAGDDVDAVMAARVDDRQELDRRARGGDIKDQIQASDVIYAFRPDLGFWPRRAPGPSTRGRHP
jgi:hypothetical protein